MNLNMKAVEPKYSMKSKCGSASGLTTVSTWTELRRYVKNEKQ